jgi:ribulose-phosphate 3-epimerase
MDGRLVQTSPSVASGRAIRAKLPLDVHLMISEPDRYIPAFVHAGAAIVTVTQAAIHLDRALNFIRSQNVLAGSL